MSRPTTHLDARRQFMLSLLFAVVVSVGLYAYGAFRMHSLVYNYLLWNLFLAFVPLLVAFRLVKVLRKKQWSDWEPIGLTLVWLLFLPNSFYMISDYIHLRDVSAAHILYAAVQFTAFICLGVLLGFCSLYLVHRELRRRLSGPAAGAWVAGTLLLCSMAIYIGRDLRWNSWDVLANPAGLLFDVTERLLKPEDYPAMFVTVGSFFALLGALYVVVWAGAKLLRSAPPTDVTAP